MTLQHTDIQTGSVTTEGDDLYYEVRGHGQPLLLIPGGSGDAGLYSFVADILCDEYKVITYDRRGNARSTRNEPQNFEISQQSRDAVAVLRAVGETAAFVFGSSSGAIIALDLAKTQPDVIKAVVAHEPPVARMLPDSERWLRFFAGLYWMALRLSVNLAMLRELQLLPAPSPQEPAVLSAFRNTLTAEWTDPFSNREGFDRAASAAQVQASGQFGDLPLVVITAGKVGDIRAGYIAAPPSNTAL